MKDPKRAEIRRVLMGRVVMGEEGQMIPIPKGEFLETPVGVADGAMSARFLGIGRTVRHYECDVKRPRTLSAAKKAMEGAGRGLALREQPEAVACFRRYVLTRPAVLVFTFEEDGTPVLTAWTGRGFTGWLSRLRVIRAFERGLPDSIRPMDKEREREIRKQQKAKSSKKETPAAGEAPEAEAAAASAEPEKTAETNNAAATAGGNGRPKGGSRRGGKRAGKRLQRK